MNSANNLHKLEVRRFDIRNNAEIRRINEEAEESMLQIEEIFENTIMKLPDCVKNMSMKEFLEKHDGNIYNVCKNFPASNKPPSKKITIDDLLRDSIEEFLQARRSEISNEVTEDDDS